MKSVLWHTEQHVSLPFNKPKPSCSLVFLSPTIEPLDFWEVLWAVGITNFTIKFLFMGIKCLILLLPSSLVTYRTQVRVWIISLDCCFTAVSWLCCSVVLISFVSVSRGDGWCWLKSWVRSTRPWLLFHCGSTTWSPTRRLTACLDLHLGSFWHCSTSYWRCVQYSIHTEIQEVCALMTNMPLGSSGGSLLWPVFNLVGPTTPPGG